MEAPQGGSPRINRRPQIVPCTYDDYQQACKEELPERWLNAEHKLS
jgi:hypothetical protein